MKENNIKIAQLMGYKYQEKLLIDDSEWGGTYTEYLFLSKEPIKFEEYERDRFIDEDWCYDRNNEIIKVECTHYDRNWNSLMGVVHYIENYTILPDDNWVDITTGSGRYCVIQDVNLQLFEFTCTKETKIKSVYQTVLEFIDWYNEHKIKSN